MTLGEYIAKYRAEHDNMSQRLFASQCGVSNGYIAMLERGVNPFTGDAIIPKLDTVAKLAKGMHVDLDELLRSIDCHTLVNVNDIIPSDQAHFDRLNTSEQNIISMYRDLNDDGKKYVTDSLRLAYHMYKKEEQT